jgi:hypothetical protein
MAEKEDYWPWWWSTTWTVILGFASVMEFLHFRREWGQRDYKNVMGPLFMGIGLGYMASESIRGSWP